MGTRCKAVIVDLDGTYIHGNSLKEFFKWLWCESLRRGQYTTTLTLIGRVAARKLRLTSHADMKRAVLERCSWLTSENIMQFCDRLRSKINPIVADSVSRYRDAGNRIVMATAAPDLYAQAFAVACGFNTCLASPHPVAGKPYKECRGEEKLAAVKQWLEDNDAEMTALFTDHADDLPLIRFNPGKTHLVTPSV